MSSPQRHLPVLDPTRDPAANLYAHTPSGWFDVARSAELPRGAVLTRRLAGKEIVLYRTESGAVRAVSPYCPHMGAHLGCGGTVRGENIVCPFHAFEFDGASGRCTRTGYDTQPPPRARLGTSEVHELHGCVFVWHGSAGEPPSFTIPHRDDDADGFFPMLDRVYEMRGHPQETNENSVDIGHFGHVHGYRNVRVVKDVELDGAALTAKYAMERPLVPDHPRFGLVYAEFEIHVHGLGYSMVDVHVPQHGFHSRHFVFATPTVPERVRLRCGFSVKKGTLALPFANRLARRAAESLFMQIGVRAFVHDVGQDFEIWKNKRYVHPPQLAVGDGPIGTFRRWCRQFYPSVVTPGGAELGEQAAE